MLKQRVITALFLLPLLAAIIFIAPINVFAGIITAVVYLLALEWAKLSGYKSELGRTLYAVLVSSANLFIWSTSGEFIIWPSPSWPMALVWDNPMIFLAAAFISIIIATVVVLTYSTLPKWWANKVIVSLLGFGLLPALFISFVSIRNIAYLNDFYRGGFFVLFMFLLIWAADTGAYFSGKFLGKHKLAPVVSPNKTWEGAIGGFILSMIVAYAGAILLNIDVNNWLLYLGVVAALAIFSVLGDLFESALKRVANIKDSGNLLPGHGGVLDRLDSTVVVAPLFFLSFSYFGWF